VDINNIPTRDLINSPVCILSFDEQINQIITWAKSCPRKIVCVANVHMLVEAAQNQHFATVLKKADLVTPDGMPLVVMLKLMGVDRSERVAGMDIFLSTCQRAAQHELSIFLLGSKPEVLDKICQRLEQEFPTLIIAGVKSPPFIPITSDLDMETVQTINASGAKIVFVALGCPKQELWMMQHREKIPAVMIGVGGVFPIYAGIMKPAPKLIQQAGLEWLFRLVQEPRRLWKRYATTIPVFLYLAFKQLVQEKNSALLIQKNNK
jgi:N-acetylglucosaminyldiphosphoundecaprenol N-acetyl-beta-D-mannosaminyltransferase